MTRPRLFAPAVLSGFLLWTAYFPLDLGLVAFVALAPLLSLVRVEGVTGRRRYLAAYVGGLAFFLPAVQWMRVAHPAMYATWVGLSLYCALYWPLAVWLLRRLDRLDRFGRPSLALTVPLVWVPLEYLRAHFPTGFPVLKPLGLFQLTGFGWYFLAHPLHGWTTLIQTADLGGAYLVSAMVAAFNGAACEWLTRLAPVRRWLRRPAEQRIGFVPEMWSAAVAAAAVIGTVMYGTPQLLRPESPRGPRVAAIQGDFPQDVKDADTERLFRTYDELCMRAAARADLVVWPETCFPFRWYQIGPNGSGGRADFEQYDRRRREEIAAKATREWRTNVLLGLATSEADGPADRQYNSALLVGRDGTFDGPYHKMHLVPFGEYVPFRHTLPFMRWLTPYEADYSCTPGDRFTRFAVNTGGRAYTFGVLICYEDSDPYLARQYVRPTDEAEPVDFLVNISNDGWFHGTAEHEQHLALCRFRAVEARRPVVRAVNMGVSAIIDADGRLQALPGDSLGGSKRITGTVTDTLKLDTRSSRYAAWGDWLPVGCGLLVLLGVAGGFVRRNGGRPASTPARP